MKFKTYPIKQVDTVTFEWGDKRPLIKRLFNIGVKEPKYSEQIPSRITIVPFEIIDWPHKLGYKIAHIELDGYDLFGVFATGLSGNIFTCICDYYEKNRTAVE